MAKHEISRKSKKRKLKIEKIIFVMFFLVLTMVMIKYGFFYKLYCVINPIKIEKIELSSENLEIEVGEQLSINYKITPENYTKSNLQWNNSNPEVIELIDGKIVGKAVGKSKIYLSNNEIRSNEIEVECLIDIDSISISNKPDKIMLGDIYKVDINVFPEEATYKELIYESSKSDIATIDNNGNIIANAIGSTTITIRDYKERKLEEFNLEVKKIPVDKISLDDQEVILGKGQEYIINAKVTPTEATYTDVDWSSSNTDVITIKNRKIKAIGIGTAKIIATTDEGDKKVSCIVKVSNEKPENTKLYANGRYNIRIGPSTDYEILATTSQYEQIEFLKDSKNGWKKVRNEKGIVGYTLVKSGYYIKEKPIVETEPLNDKMPNNVVTSFHIKNVPYLNQISLGYPTGCEAVSATMVLKYKGYKVSVQDIINNTKTGSKKYKGKDGKWYGGNPFEEFVGKPSLGLSKGSYGVFAKPIADAMSVYAGKKVKNISGCSESQLLGYVSKGNPIVVWCVKNAGNLKDGILWNYEDSSGTFQELVGEHCAVLIGYDEEYIYLNDPSAGQNVKQSRSKFMSNWKRLYSQAIVVE